MKKFNKPIQKIPYLLLCMLCFCMTAVAQNRITVKGVVLDGENEPVIGANVVLKSNSAVGVATDIDGKFSIVVPNDKEILRFSYVGMKDQELPVQTNKAMTVVLQEDTELVEEIVMVGYGQQKKASVVGAISQTSGENLKRTGGVTSVGAALTGNIPGLITVQSVGTPGQEDPTLYIRGMGTWNNSAPLILVDGAERSVGRSTDNTLSTLDINSIENISVLKDASATAVYGVRGANGVILITTKRGQAGKAVINVSGSATMKTASTLPDKYDAYDAIKYRNMAIERELPISEGSWSSIIPGAERAMYRNQTTTEQKERYPNVDWFDALFKDYCMSYNGNMSVSGGTNQARYFTSFDYSHEGDIMRSWDNSKGYKPGYAADRMNVRANFDLELTKTTKLALNLSANHQDTKNTGSGYEYRMWQSAYSMAPDLFLPRYSDGLWGFYLPDNINTSNSAREFANTGVSHSMSTRISTDFILTQNLDFVTKGLSLNARLSLNNSFGSSRGISDVYDSSNAKYIDPVTGVTTYQNRLQSNGYDWVSSTWGTNAGSSTTGRTVYYQIQANYRRSFNLHNVTGMGIFQRTENAYGSTFPNYREEWVGRVTYDYDNRYLFEFNGAYNGSEKFSSNNRFAFFPSLALGWVVSQEKFMKDIKWLDMLKIRGSWGQVGDDSGAGRWQYMTSWSYGNKAPMGKQLPQWWIYGADESPYTQYRESTLGNEDIHWEKVTKKNIGADFSFFNGLLAGTVEYFNDYRTDILMSGGSRAVPNYFGGTPATGNLGEVEVKGYEVELRSNYTFPNQVRAWASFSITHSKDNIKFHDDPKLLPAYQKSEGFQIGQGKYKITSDWYTTWDELYGSTIQDTYDAEKLPGETGFVDFNADGIIDDYDKAPYGYPTRPQNTYNWTLGFEYKGFSAYVQFYAVNNVSRYWGYGQFNIHTNILFDEGTFWTKETANSADAVMPRWNSNSNYASGSYYLYDASYIRLKNAEVSYTFNNKWIKKIGLGSLRVYLNGNNLYLWSKLPDDRESTGNVHSFGGYPTMKRFNLGVNFTL